MCDSLGECWITYNGEVYNHVELRSELEREGERFQSTSDTEVILAAYRRHGRECLSLLNGMFAFAIWDGRRRELFCARDRLRIERWWRIDSAARAEGGPEDWSRRFAELFTDSVSLRLRADVEVGSCLSGGIDSSAVVTTASRLAGRPLHAFTCAYNEGPAYD